MFLQSYIVPVCTIETRDGEAYLRKLLGTAFFVGREGYFLTATHVLKQAHEAANNAGHQVALVVKGDNGRSPGEFITGIIEYDFAPNPYDIAAGRANYKPASPILVRPFQVGMWQDAMAIGYPESSSVNDDDALWINIRGHKGYVQRTTLPRDMMHFGIHPDGIELSFLLGPGSSGAPIFTPDKLLIGVGVGSYRSERVEEALTEVDDDGKRYEERRVRVEQFGFAHSITGLLGWQSTIFGGLTLQDIALT